MFSACWRFPELSPVSCGFHCWWCKYDFFFPGSIINLEVQLLFIVSLNTEDYIYRYTLTYSRNILSAASEGTSWFISDCWCRSNSETGQKKYLSCYHHWHVSKSNSFVFFMLTCFPGPSRFSFLGVLIHEWTMKHSCSLFRLHTQNMDKYTIRHFL